jgi:predicted DNA-binding transcriptional regulator AlpA
MSRISVLVAIGLVGLALAAFGPGDSARAGGTCGELGLQWTSAKVVRAFGRWRNACQALKGGWVPETAQQRILRRSYFAQDRTHEDYVVAVREWLETKPAREFRTDYDDWTRDRNGRLKEGEKPLPGIKTVQNALPIEWERMLRIAKGDGDLADELQSAIAEATKDEAEPLVGLTAMALILGRSKQHAADWLARDDFPKPVARLVGKRVWLKEDIEAVRNGESFPKREPYSMQHLYMDQEGIEQILGKPYSSWGNKISQQRWDKVPKPAGRHARTYYWLRSEVYDWLARRDAERWGGPSIMILVSCQKMKSPGERGR